jgi:hypothetical protein
MAQCGAFRNVSFFLGDVASGRDVDRMHHGHHVGMHVRNVTPGEQESHGKHGMGGVLWPWPASGAAKP